MNQTLNSTENMAVNQSLEKPVQRKREDNFSHLQMTKEEDVTDLEHKVYIEHLG